ncbi:alkyl sulfatase dimerization domain-containing protein [Leptospira sp. 'Mane']|uniref:alkyl sulfatase dimerization domain-containing protein n=1 Tax=Leptospira sp. 'Mane' TaxID=3387407 RepID=UPI00398B3EA3
MKTFYKFIRLTVIVSIFFYLSQCSTTKQKTTTSDHKLENFNKEFEKKIYNVAPGIYSAVGFGIANSILIVGDDGLIIVDTMDDLKSGKEVFDEFKKISDLPITAIIYTHSHPDHIFGSQSFVGESNPEIYAHESLLPAVQKLASETTPIIGTRSARMFGNYLNENELVNVGIGPYQGYNSETKLDFVPPTKTFKDSLEVKISGVRLKLIHAPGETDDQIYIYLPEKNVLMSGDNFYKAFPNLYTIRGTWFRSLKNWYKSLDIIRSIHPEHLIPSHGKPLSGGTEIAQVVTDYRDAIQFVHDQSLRGINAGLNPDDLVEYVKLPSHLSKSPYLQEIYGKVSWSVRSLFNGNLGWFSGDSNDLHPLSRDQHAQLISDLAGGKENLLGYAKAKFKIGDFQSVLTLTGHLLRIDPKNSESKNLRIQSLEALGKKEENANSRHYYLTEALELKNNFVAKIQVKPSSQLLKRYPLSVIFSSFVTNLDPIASATLDKKVSLVFIDTNESFTIHLRKGVAEVIPTLLADSEIIVHLNSQDWKEVLVRIKNPLTTLSGFEYKKGNVLEFIRFLKLFSPLEPILSYEKPKI